jgi:chemotaxis protein methyltransferase CheR
VPVLSEEREAAWTIPVLTDEEYEQFRRLVSEHTGISLRDSKRNLLVARLAQRLRELRMASFSEYYDFVMRDSSGAELTAFINRITTNKTSFFREPGHFDFLVRKLLPAVTDRRLRIWSAACSSGEEPYSIAMAVREALGSAPGWNIRILASDIDTEMLRQAELGVYRAESLSQMSAERQRAHFLRGFGDCSGMVQVRPELRRMIEFRRVNLIESAWPVAAGRCNAVFCRNAIIYFEPPTQEHIVRRLAACLRPDGYLFVGHSENLYWMKDVLATVEPTVHRLVKGGSGK